MSIASITEHAFLQTCQARGTELWRRGCVRLIKNQNHSATFNVRGSKLYHIKIEVPEKSGAVTVRCTCPHFEQGNTCKHIWASLLEASKRQLFPKVAGPIAVELSDKELEDPYLPDPKPTHAPPPVAPAKRVKAVSWREQIARAQAKIRHEETGIPYNRIENEKVVSFAIDLPNSERQKKIQLRFLTQERLKNGGLGVFKQAELSQQSIRQFPAAQDRELLLAILGRTELSTSYSYYAHARGVPGAGIPSDFAENLLHEISQAGKLYLQKHESYSVSRNSKLMPDPYRFEPESWQLVLVLRKNGNSFELSAELRSATGRQDLDEAIGCADRFVFFEEYMAPSNLDRKINWFEIFKKTPQLEIPEDEIDVFLTSYLQDRNAPELDLPPEIHFADSSGVEPKVRLVFSNIGGSSLIKAQLAFKYSEQQVFARDAAQHIFDIKTRQRIARNFEYEAAAKQLFLGLEALSTDLLPAHAQNADGFFHESTFLQAADRALKLNWEVVANQRRVLFGSTFDMSVASGTDWFDVNAQFDFQGTKMSLPDLLAQIVEGERFISLGDGSYGILPAEWVKRFGPMAEIGQTTHEGIRLSKIQALFLTADFSENEKFTADRKFHSLTKIIDQLKTNKPSEPPAGFKGDLRGYQKEGLAWLQVIAKNEIGGILADDMGLGKTVQVLALIGAKKPKNQDPHLVVAPKSLIFNWIQEAQRFTPHLKILNLTGSKRSASVEEFAEYDVVITTYQTLRSDIEVLKQARFDCLILDEAHYAKNPKSQAAMACRLIQAKRKFALTGTPVENSLNDLFSILAIVNPGLLSDSHAQGWVKEKDPEAFARLSRALKPFILRRTKERVLKELPAKTEQVIYCELSESERKRYDDLRNYYWSQLSGKFEQKGLGRSKIDVLEALLRLRQASCHQGLLDDNLRGELSTKFEMLIEQLEAVIQDGRKALVFSQFTSLLALLKNHLESRGIVYEYLDGQTKDRQQRVEKFQADPEIKVFLLSLKAGGVGLNLTSADYVFILDPWWNPAAESQAIDRTHRIGQKNKVFAYKIIAKNTVEEKILALQESKKQLAKTLITDEKSVFKNLTVQDLQALFS